MLVELLLEVGLDLANNLNTAVVLMTWRWNLLKTMGLLTCLKVSRCIHALLDKDTVFDPLQDRRISYYSMWIREAETAPEDYPDVAELSLALYDFNHF